MIAGFFLAAVSFLEPTIVPRPVEIAFSDDREVVLGSIGVDCPSASADAVTWVTGKARKWFGAVGVNPCRMESAIVPGGDESYELTASGSNVLIRANGLAGIRHAMQTLRQTAIARRGTERTEGWVLPELTVRDRPALAFRGIHLCWFPGVSVRTMERLVRLAAAYKFNYAVIEPWGVYRWKSHPKMCWHDASVTQSDVRHLVEVGRDLGITLCPQLNVYGHAAMSRFIGGKHATLDRSGDLAPLFEPVGGWNWCLTNPETRRILWELVAELCEAFGNPPYFHIGCDEAQKPSCPNCRMVDRAVLVGDHIAGIAAFLRNRGVRAMMWHDMLLDKSDSRWEGFYAFGDASSPRLVERLPKDIVICDWYYGGREQGFFGKLFGAGADYPTMDYFRTCGFEFLTCPFDNYNWIDQQVGYARTAKALGMLYTTWHRACGKGFAYSTFVAANAGWGVQRTGWTGAFARLVVATHLRQVGWDMGSPTYEETGFVSEDVSTRTNPDMFGD